MDEVRVGAAGALATALPAMGRDPELGSVADSTDIKDDTTRYCCCLTEKQIKYVGRATGIVLVIVGIAALAFGWFSTASLLGGSGALNLCSGVGVIYYTENFQGLGMIVRALREERRSLAAERKRLDDLSKEKARQADDLRAQIEALAKVDDDLTSAAAAGVDGAQRASALLTATAARTHTAVVSSVTAGMGRLHEGVATELTRLEEGTRGYVAMAREIAQLRAENARLRAAGATDAK